MADPPTPIRRPRRRWYQYRLRTLLIGIVLLSLHLGWLGWKVREARQQQAAVAAIEKLGGVVGDDYRIESSLFRTPKANPTGPAWLHAVLGDEFFRNIAWVSLTGATIKNADLEPLKVLTQLGGLSLADTNVSDAGLDYLEEMIQLQGLDLRHTQVTDAGLERLKRLAQLKLVNLLIPALPGERDMYTIVHAHPQ